MRHHLLLVEVATRRDLGDDDVAREVTPTVGSLELPRTARRAHRGGLAGDRAPAWGPWKAELVAELVERVAAVLRGDDPATAVQRQGFPDAGVHALIDARADPVVRSDPPTITVVGPDRPGVFSRIAGTLALRGLTVLAAEAASEDGMAASRLPRRAGDRRARVGPRDGRHRHGVGGPPRDRRPARRPARHPPSSASAPDPRRRADRAIDNQASGTATIVEVRGPDRVGVLYRITRALADLDLDIRSTKVATLGDEVIDTFYVCDSGGGKVIDGDHLREVERAILHQLAASRDGRYETARS